MDCPHCERLRRQYSSEAEREARAILAQRSSWLGLKLAGDLNYDTLQTLVYECRKKQAQLTHLLHEHELIRHSAA
jgi:hypothetical protein